MLAPRLVDARAMKKPAGWRFVKKRKPGGRVAT